MLHSSRSLTSISTSTRNIPGQKPLTGGPTAGLLWGVKFAGHHSRSRIAAISFVALQILHLPNTMQKLARMLMWEAASLSPIGVKIIQTLPRLRTATHSITAGNDAAPGALPICPSFPDEYRQRVLVLGYKVPSMLSYFAWFLRQSPLHTSNQVRTVRLIRNWTVTRFRIACMADPKW